MWIVAAVRVVAMARVALRAGTGAGHLPMAPD